MGAGTPALGKHGSRKTHIRCRRCGYHSYNIHEKRCSHCGYPAPRLRSYNWAKKH